MKFEVDVPVGTTITIAVGATTQVPSCVGGGVTYDVAEIEVTMQSNGDVSPSIRPMYKNANAVKEEAV